MTAGAATIIRPYANASDLEDQYALWLKATDRLPYAWRSNLMNARCVSQHAAEHPRARWYAEREGVLVGYIGTHPPVQWSTGQWLMPFGFPWTFPYDAELEQSLDERMLAAAPDLYPDSERPTAYVQRFRSSWTHHLSFLEARGWKRRWTQPLLGYAVESNSAAARVAIPLNDNLDALARIAAADVNEPKPPTLERLKRSFAGGWLEPHSTWIVSNIGAFEIEVRQHWGEVRLLLTTPAADHDDTFWRALYAKAAELGASEVYFTIDDAKVARRAQLEQQGFRPVDADMYLLLEAPPP